MCTNYVIKNILKIYLLTKKKVKKLLKNSALYSIIIKLDVR